MSTPRKGVTQSRARPENGSSPEPDPDPQGTPNGVFVHRLSGDKEGDFQIAVEPIGDVRITEIDTILKIAVRDFRGKMGLEE